MPADQPVVRLRWIRGGLRGALLIVAMLLATAHALILTSDLSLSRASLKMAHRTFYARDAANLADIGLEEAMSCFDLMGAGTTAATGWSGWRIPGVNARRTFPTFSTYFNRDQNGLGQVRWM